MTKDIERMGEGGVTEAEGRETGCSPGSRRLALNKVKSRGSPKGQGLGAGRRIPKTRNQRRDGKWALTQ